MNKAPNQKNITYIVDNDLCIRCGACVGVCPYDDVIAFGDSYFPTINNACYTHSSCSICLSVCPVADIDLPLLYHRVHGRKVDLDAECFGPFRELYVGHSTAQEIREIGSSGGVVTQLLISLLNLGMIDAAIVATSDTTLDKPWQAMGVFATTAHDILESSGSKYTIAPVNKQLKALKAFEGKIAFVGLPCHIQSYRMWEGLSRRIRDQVVLTLGLMCSLTLELDAIPDWITHSGIPSDDVEGFRYRTGTWPGKPKVRGKDGGHRELRGVDMTESFRYLAKSYYPAGCLNCVDYAGDLADISIGDPWLRGTDGEFLYPGKWSLVVSRTERGSEALRAAAVQGDLVLRNLRPELWLQNQEDLARTKRRRALYRIQGLEKRGRPSPNYHWDVEYSLSERLRYTFFQIFLRLARTKLGRGMLMRAMCSTWGEGFTRFKRRTKKWRFRYRRRGS